MWTEREEHQQAREIIQQLRVVNDFAELSSQQMLICRLPMMKSSDNCYFIH